MASFLFWVFLSFVALLVGFIIGGLIYFIYSRISNHFIKRGIPRDVSPDPENKLNTLAYPGKKYINEKEVKEREHRRWTEFREPEKLRRLAKGESKFTDISLTAPSREGVQGRNSVQSRSDDLFGKTDTSDTKFSGKADGDKYKIKFSDPNDF